MPAEPATELPDPFARFDAALHPQAAQALAAVRGWVQSVTHNEPRGLVLWSTTYGAGKTLLARCAHAYVRQCSHPGINGARVAIPITFLGAAEMFAHLRDLYALQRPEWPAFREWTAGHVVLDDLGKAHVRADSLTWAQEKFFLLLDGVYQKRGLLLTSNLEPDQIAAFLGGASWSRLFGMCGADGFIDLSAIPDYRETQWRGAQ